MRRSARHAAPITTGTRSPTLGERLRGGRRPRTTTKRRHGHTMTGKPTTTTTTTTTCTTHTTHPRGAAPHHGVGAGPLAAPRRKPTLGDKVSGALMRLRGSLTRRPGLKAAGARRMHGTDGRLVESRHAGRHTGRRRLGGRRTRQGFY